MTYHSARAKLAFARVVLKLLGSVSAGSHPAALPVSFHISAEVSDGSVGVSPDAASPEGKKIFFSPFYLSQPLSVRHCSTRNPRSCPPHCSENSLSLIFVSLHIIEVETETAIQQFQLEALSFVLASLFTHSAPHQPNAVFAYMTRRWPVSLFVFRFFVFFLFSSSIHQPLHLLSLYFALVWNILF